VAKQDGNLVDGHPGQQHLDSEGVAKHMRVAALRFAVGFANVGNREETAVGPLPVGDEGLGIAIARPEEIARVGLAAIWHSAQQLGHMGRQRDVDGNAGLGLVE
jgi:hypothetical protein